MNKQLVIIGAGVGGLSAAIHARLAGYDVLVLEQGPTAGGKAAGIQIEGYNLDPGPSIIILPGFYEAVFRAAGRKMADYLQFDRLDVVSRVFLGKEAPIDLPADRTKALAILEDINPLDAKSLRKILDQMAKVEPLLHKSIYDHPYLKQSQLLDLNLLRFGMGFNPMKTFKEHVDHLFQSDIMRAFFYGFPSYAGQTYNAKSPGSFLIPFYMLQEGVFFPVGGVRAIPLAFERLAKELGVEFRFGARVSSVEGSNGRMKAVVLADGERVEADAFVSNLDRFTFSSLRGKPLDFEPSYSYFTVHWGVRREFPNLQHHNLFIPTNYLIGFKELYETTQFPKEPIVYVNSASVADPLAAPSGCSNIFAVVTAPAVTGRFEWSSAAAEYVNRTRAVMRNVGLDWDDSEVDFTRIQTPEYFESAHGNYRGSLYGLHESHRLFGMFPEGNEDAEWSNLKFCGGSVQPGAGLPMVTLSGKFAVDLLTK